MGILSTEIRAGKSLARKERMGFICQQCGECCSIMGEVLSILEDYGSGRFLLLNRYTGEKSQVSLDADKKSLYFDTDGLPNACPFLRFSHPEGKAYCTVHQTRPEMCRDFGCWRLLILDAAGNRAGRVMQRRYFCPEESALALIWEAKIRDIDEPDDQRWDRSVIQILTREGYTVIR
jgi:Fe-S-cluster containining protein